MKNSIAKISLACAAALCLPGAVWAQGAAVGGVVAKGSGAALKAGEVEVRAKVVELDKARRLATLKGPKGNIVSVEVPAEAKNFDQIRVGDDVVIRYAAAVAVRLEPASKSGIRERVESTSAATAASGAMPGAAAQRTVEVLAQVQAIDRKARTVTLRGAKRTATLMAPEGMDLSKLKVGDEVHAVMVEALVLNVERVAAK
jgi:Cu/Ag efflux protein CusF